MKSVDLILCAILVVLLMIAGATGPYVMHVLSIAAVIAVALFWRLGYAAFQNGKSRRDPYSISELRRTQEEEDLERIKSWHDETRHELPND